MRSGQADQERPTETGEKPQLTDDTTRKQRRGFADDYHARNGDAPTLALICRRCGMPKGLQKSLGTAIAPRMPDAKKPDWKAIRYEYETTQTTHRALAAKHNVPYSTLSRRAFTEKWSQRAKLVAQTAHKLESELTAQMKQEVRDELAPWIAEKRKLITKRSFTIAERGIDRIQEFYEGSRPDDAKVESDAARTIETLTRVARTALGMNDGAGIGGALNVQILTNQAAVAIAPTSQDS